MRCFGHVLKRREPGADAGLAGKIICLNWFGSSVRPDELEEVFRVGEV